ncbi:sortase family protein [Kribbella sp. VKM Ac-2571]|uniref:class F sortase n=1 Tax=Kribbella sp. VKM Ac-2571 TaxID=2512222 RepID=UPI001061C3B6|nr:class F sortase [Kribbella sp. VKM Ac-2571]TDO48931.1 sortase family protein [Kribbella sp. VKM Ac-2571]
MISNRCAAILAMAALAVVIPSTGCSSPGRQANERNAPAASTTSPTTSPTDSSTESPTESPAVSPSVAGIPARPADPPAVRRSVPPVRLQIQAIGIDLPVLPVGVASNGQMDLPPDPATIGWYRFGPGIDSTTGSVVLGGHLDSKQYGVGPLVRLRKLRPGGLIVVRSAKDETTTYRVRQIEQVPKTGLALDRVFARDGSPALWIVTCGGPYDRDLGGYRDNLVVTATPA